MRVVDILRETGLPFAACAFNNPPDETYVVYNEEITRRGGDLLNCITEHDATVEVYAYDFHDEEAVRSVMRALDRRAVDYKRYDTVYINSEHLYQTRFEFGFVQKDSGTEKPDFESGYQERFF